MSKRKPCCSGGVCPECNCCVCICTKELKNILTPKAQKRLLKALA